MNDITIAGRKIGRKFPPYVIAEMSANHNGDLGKAFKIIEEAKKAGADALKIQTYTPDTITINSAGDEFLIEGGLWDGRTLYELYQEAHMPWEWHKPIFEHAHKLDITIFSSPFDHTAVDLLEDLNAPAYKIASFEAVDLELIRYAASTKKPMIISTGLANLEEIEIAINTAKDAGCNELAILHCVSGYPAPAQDYNLLTIPDLIQRFNIVTGLSDHTLGNVTAIASVALGASIIEKHFTLDREGGGPDDSFSLTPPELSDLCLSAHTAWDALGEVDYSCKSSEKANIKFRRSLYVVENINAGDFFTERNLRSIRPGFGLAPKFFSEVIGKKSSTDIKKGTALKWKHIIGS